MKNPNCVASVYVRHSLGSFTIAVVLDLDCVPKAYVLKACFLGWWYWEVVDTF